MRHLQGREGLLSLLVNFIPREPFSLWGEVLETGGLFSPPLPTRGGQAAAESGLSAGQGLRCSRRGSETVQDTVSFKDALPPPVSPGVRFRHMCFLSMSSKGKCAGQPGRLFQILRNA